MPNNLTRTLIEAERVKAERRYKRLLDSVMRYIRTRLKKAQSLSDIKRILDNLANSKMFRELCEKAAEQSVTMLARGQMHSWRAAAAASSRGREIYKALQKELKTSGRGLKIDDIINQNSTLIKTVPQNLANKFSHMAKSTEFAGMRPGDLTKELLKQAPYLTDVEARRIARTESAKAATALLQARSEDIGLNFYIWDSCHDQRVRDAHEYMNGVVCAWDDPPNPERLCGVDRNGKRLRVYNSYHAGCIFNCRCTPLPVVDARDLKFPLKAHKNGKIIKINNLKKFEAVFNVSLEAGEKNEKTH